MKTSESILKAAKKRFNRDGLEGVSIRNVAQDVGVTPMAIYRHYADKGALVDALTADALEEWRIRVTAISSREPMRWLESAFDAFLDFAVDTPRQFEAAFVIPARNARRYPDDVLAGKSEPLNMIIARIAQAQNEGRLDDTSPTEVAITMWALGQGLISLFRAGRFAGDEKDFRALYHVTILRTLSSFIRNETRK